MNRLPATLRNPWGRFGCISYSSCMLVTTLPSLLLLPRRAFDPLYELAADHASNHRNAGTR
jgi:hypothetical protein